MAEHSLSIFSKIIRREIPAHIVYETEKVIAFRDINPQAPVHVLIIPKEEVKDITHASGSMLQELIQAASEVARLEGIFEKGFRIVTNIGKEGGQTVFHLHLHLLGGQQLGWTPG